MCVRPHTVATVGRSEPSFPTCNKYCVLCVHFLHLFASHVLCGGTHLSNTMQGAVLHVGVRPRACEATVLTHMQLLAALTISVAGGLPVHLSKMSFK